MSKLMKLKGSVSLQSDKRLLFCGQLIGNTPFSVLVDQFDVQLNEDFLPNRTTVDGFLFVNQLAEQANVVAIRLPKPSLTYGQNVNVDKILLSPRNVSIQDFNPSKRKKSKKSEA